MAKTKIEFTYDSKDFVLEFTAKTIKELEKKGFDFSNIGSHLLNATEELFFGAFEANHSDVKTKVRRKIFEEISGEDEDGGEKIGEVLFAMVNEALEELKPSGNLKWKVTAK